MVRGRREEKNLRVPNQSLSVFAPPFTMPWHATLKLFSFSFYPDIKRYIKGWPLYFNPGSITNYNIVQVT